MEGGMGARSAPIEGCGDGTSPQDARRHQSVIGLEEMWEGITRMYGILPFIEKRVEAHAF